MGVLEPGVQSDAPVHRRCRLASRPRQRQLTLEVWLPRAHTRRGEIPGTHRTRPLGGASHSQHSRESGDTGALPAHRTGRAARSGIEGFTTQDVNVGTDRVGKGPPHLIRTQIQEQGITGIKHPDLTHSDPLRYAWLGGGRGPALLPHTALLAHDSIGRDAGIHREVGRITMARAGLLPGEDVEVAQAPVFAHVQKTPGKPLHTHIARGFVRGEKLAHDRLRWQVTGIAQPSHRAEIALQGLARDLEGGRVDISHRGGARLLKPSVRIGTRGQDGVRRLAGKAEGE